MRINYSFNETEPSEAQIANRLRYPWFTASGGSPSSTFETNEHGHHRIRRAAISRFFSKQAILNIEPIIVTEVANLSTLLQGKLHSKSVVDLRLAYSSVTLDIISHYCFGKTWGCLSNPALGEEWKHTFEEIFSKASLIMHFPWLLAALNSLPDSLAGPMN